MHTLWISTCDINMCVSYSVTSNFLRPHGLLFTRLLCSWNSPSKNTGVGCHFILQGIFPTQRSSLGLLHCRRTLYHLSHQGYKCGGKGKCKLLSRVWSLCDPMAYNSPWDSLGQNIGVCSRSPLQGIFPAQGSNSGLPHFRWIIYQLSPQGSP